MRRATQGKGLETLDPKAEAEGSSEYPKAFFHSHYLEKLCVGSTLYRQSRSKIGKC
jgi:hypothetical protein